MDHVVVRKSGSLFEGERMLRSHDTRSGNKRRWRAVLAALALGVIPVATVGAPAEADHIYAPYPSRGYLWFATRHDNAIAWVTSTDCRPRELEVWDAVKSSTTGDFPSKWPSGIRFSRSTCNGQVTSNIDVKLSYEPASNFVRSNGTSYGGWNENKVAPASWCAVWAVSSPCGTHPAIVHLNVTRFTNAAYSHAYRRRLIMHETGHSLGLNHHCNSNSVMNDGTGSCNGGAFTNISGYQGTDHRGIRNIYPNWMY
ncbi:M12 family metallo-peptidase [Pimelobacter simplex]|uniref:M12 family metallo-peptidase n=1 Tax=Nocardioides simplex TaxID=2045 RepID=UPI003800377E